MGEIMQALIGSREMDAWVAEHVLGWRRVVDDTKDYQGVRHMNEVLMPPGATWESMEFHLPRSGPIAFGFFASRWSTDQHAAWDLLWEMRTKRGATFDITAYEQGFTVSTCTREPEHRIGVGIAKDFPLALCLALLDTVPTSSSHQDGEPTP